MRVGATAEMMARRTWSSPRSIPLLVALLIVGCASLPYVPVEGTVAPSKYGFQVTMPPGWYRATAVEDRLLMTRDGLLLQSINVGRTSIDEALKLTGRKFDDTMSPSQAAGLEIDEVRSFSEHLDLSVEDNSLAVVAGRPAFRLVYAWHTRGGLRLKAVHYGFVDGRWVYHLIYRAAVRHYFDRDLDAFEQVRESFRLLET